MHKKTHTLNNDFKITCTMVAVADLYIIMEPLSLAKELRRLSCDLLNEQDKLFLDQTSENGHGLRTVASKIFMYTSNKKKK